MAYQKVPRPSTVYHLAQKGNLDSILDDGVIRRFNDTECWFCESLDKMKSYMEQTVMCEDKPYYAVGGQLCRYPKFVPEDYDSVLYEGGVSLHDYENCIRIGKELQLCGEANAANEIVTHRDAAMLLHAILTRAFAVTAPAAPVTLVNAADVNINDYLLALWQVPEPVLAAFNVAGWTYCIDFDYMGGLSKKLNMSCIGATNYSQKTIYLSDASATLHEFGHFLDWRLGFPVEHEHLYLAEAQNSGLRDYAKTNAIEYFADCFDYWITYSADKKRMDDFRDAAPQTYAYMKKLATNNWGA